MSETVSLYAAGKLVGLTRQRMSVLFREGRIIGAERSSDGRRVMVPVPVEIIKGRRKKTIPAPL